MNSKRIHHCNHMLPAILALLLSAGLLHAGGYDITITSPTNQLTFPECDEFSGMIAGKTWDMSELYDITHRARFDEPFAAPDGGIWYGAFYGEDLPGHYWPLFRGWVTTPNYLQYFARHHPGTPYGPLNPIAADHFNRLSIRHSLPADKRSYFDVVWCKTLLETETNLFRFTDGDVPSGYFIPYQDGFRIYDIDLTGETFNADRIRGFSGSPTINGTWDGTIYGFYIIPSLLARSGTDYAVDWIRLYQSDPAGRIEVAWTNSDLYVDTNNVSVQLYVVATNSSYDEIHDEGDLFLSGIANDGRMTFHTGALPPGDYYLYLKLMYDVQENFYELGRSEYSPLIRINARPTFEFISPSFTSGVEYAAAERGNAWDMSGADDIDLDRTVHIANVYFTADGKLRANNLTGDPQIALSLLNPQGAHVPIPTADYRYLTFRMSYDSSPYPSSSFATSYERDNTIGAVARLQWVYTDFVVDGSYTKDIILQEGWYEYTVDLWDRGLLEESSRYDQPNAGWTNVPEVNFFIFHPMEPSVPITFELDYVKICAPNAPVDNIFPIRWITGDAEGDQLSVTLYCGTGIGDGFVGAEIVTLTDQTAGAGIYLWNTENVPTGEYTIRAVVSDGLNTLVRDAPTPVNVQSDTPPAPPEGPIIRANGVAEWLNLRVGSPLTLTAEFHATDALRGIDADWWAVAWDETHNNWYYCAQPNQWASFNGDLSLCLPAHQGPLMDVPPLAILSNFAPCAGVYYIYFAVDEMDGILNYPDGLLGFNYVTVVAE